MEQIRLELVPSGIEQTAHASQLDRGRQIRFNLFNGGSAYTLSGAETITMVVNGQEEAVANTSDNYIVWDVAPEDCETEGVIECELRIVENDVLIGSKNFFLEVEYDPYGAGVVILSVSGNPVSFETDLADNLVSLSASIVATQASGTPTPSNPLPISGISSLEITANGDTFTIDLGGTRYGGVYTADGKLRVTHEILDMGSINWNKLVISASVTGYQTSSLPTGIKPNIDNNTVPDILCDVFTADTVNRGYTGDNTECLTENIYGYVTIYTQTEYTDGAAFKAAMNGFKFAYPLATPIEIDVSSISVNAVSGVNNITSNGGGDVTVEYIKKV